MIQYYARVLLDAVLLCVIHELEISNMSLTSLEWAIMIRVTWEVLFWCRHMPMDCYFAVTEAYNQSKQTCG